MWNARCTVHKSNKRQALFFIFLATRNSYITMTIVNMRTKLFVHLTDINMISSCRFSSFHWSVTLCSHVFWVTTHKIWCCCVTRQLITTLIYTAYTQWCSLLYTQATVVWWDNIVSLACMKHFLFFFCIISE